MKKFVKAILFLFALSSIAYAEDDGMSVLNKKRAEGLNPQDEKEAMEILDGMRKKIKKEDTETLKLQQEAKELGISTSEAASLAEIEAMVKAKKAEKAKPKTEAEKLEATRKEALDKLDFYERVVRSVAREEAEVAGYYEIMNDDVKTTEAIEQATPVEGTVQQQ